MAAVEQKPMQATGTHFPMAVAATLDKFDKNYAVSSQGLERVSASSNLLVAANSPHAPKLR